jgi:predicted  nucleic acid-binding Zn-ribbon protein
MNGILQNLLKLQSLEFGDKMSASDEVEISTLRTQVPQPILGHYDRLRARGKKGIAVVRNQVCTGCHMRLPIGTINTLMQGTDIQLCDSCGRYLYLPTPDETSFVEAVAATKPVPKPRKRRALANA